MGVGVDVGDVGLGVGVGSAALSLSPSLYVRECVCMRPAQQERQEKHRRPLFRHAVCGLKPQPVPASAQYPPPHPAIFRALACAGERGREREM